MTMTSSFDGAIGIDLGNTHACVAVAHNGHVEIITDELGNRTTPAYVAFTEKDRLVGDAAKSQLATNPSNTIFDLKYLTGYRFRDDEIQRNIGRWPFTVIDKDILLAIQVQDKGETTQFYPGELTVMVLSKMKAIAEGRLRKSIQKTVITVPAYFNSVQRHATKDAGRNAGLNVIHVLDEPTAAAIAYGYGPSNNRAELRNKKILVFRLGGTTFEVTLLSVGDHGDLKVLATNEDKHFGGVDFDHRLRQHFHDEFKRQRHGGRIDISEDPRAMFRLQAACERAKIALSSQTETSIEIMSLVDGIDFQVNISRTKFEDLCSDLFTRIVKPMEAVLSHAGLQKEDVSEIILVGGSTHIPKIQSILSKFFGGKELLKSIHPEEVVAYGAAVDAAGLTMPHHIVQETLEDC